MESRFRTDKGNLKILVDSTLVLIVQRIHQLAVLHRSQKRGPTMHSLGWCFCRAKANMFEAALCIEAFQNRGGTMKYFDPVDYNDVVRTNQLSNVECDAIV